MKETFNILKGWTSRFVLNGEELGGILDLCNDPRLQWHLEQLGDVRGKTCLELGALEGAHTKTLEEAGAIVTAIEGNENNFLKCLVVKNAFDLKAKFIFADFCEWVENRKKELLELFNPLYHYNDIIYKKKFDFVSAAGVLYHQKNPAQLIYDLAKITDTVIVWSQVASDEFHKNRQTIAESGKIYYGIMNYYGSKLENYCGGLNGSSFWMYANSMKQCFQDAGFQFITEEPTSPTVHGEAVMFVARKNNT